MTSWSVEIEVVGNGDPISTDRLEDLLDVLEPYSPTVTGTPEEPAADRARFGMSLWIDADQPSDALKEAGRVLAQATRKVRLPQWPIARILLLSDEELDRELALPSFPTLLGVAELAEKLGVTKQRASELASSRRFPSPIATLASGPVWLAPSINRYLEEWERKPGRPAQSARAGGQEVISGVANYPGQVQAGSRPSKGRRMSRSAWIFG